LQKSGRLGENGVIVAARLSRGRTSGLSCRRSALYSPNARFDELLHLPVGANVWKVNDGAMHDIEKHNPQLAGVLAARPATEYPVRLITQATAWRFLWKPC
jgi:hypothetical protein